MLKSPKKVSSSGTKQRNWKFFVPFLICSSAFVIAIGSLVYRAIMPCSIGQHKVGVISCKFYEGFSDVPINQLSGEFQYSGSTSLLALANQAHAKVSEVYQQISLEYKTLDAISSASEEVIAWSSEGIKELIEGKIDIAFSSRRLTQEELDILSQTNFKLEAIPVAKSGLAFFVDNEENRFNRLTLEQIKEIYTSPNVSSNQLGISVESFPLSPFSPDPVNNQGQPEYFQKEILENESFASNVETQPNITKLIQSVSQGQGRIGFADASLVCSQDTVKPIEIERNGGFFPPCLGSEFNKKAIADSSYPLTRELFVVFRRDGGDSERLGIAYISMLLSNEGQRFVSEVGYAPIRTLETLE